MNSAAMTIMLAAGNPADAPMPFFEMYVRPLILIGVGLFVVTWPLWLVLAFVLAKPRAHARAAMLAARTRGQYRVARRRRNWLVFWHTLACVLGLGPFFAVAFGAIKGPVIAPQARSYPVHYPY
ncbi:Transmembrane protein OS=Tsukamurella paurometabola (strain ATCC 8368 / DSM / CCUG 35730 / CIP 100753 / JCM 10117 / KCTC 9821 / NBRC 16120 / NCIMB 702349/ NCTC 13040) OX=521096 GN=Tpau_4249 PE=4 SV=1 [Tsukamurella paurometabola]|uniref:Transmembrane protein n=1 Tax=Tsukamurella paurometabola (strain ATCC 8368 / DSM 20162 / CCUG 35730 / CIP 100753 / JCM 10117 / KCTC 9821 / NBRC 16120 / NCIMB 702349 / NCTC 13040) TaxID=521096 RepID=D5UYX0_TSUPD|nr:hypothetical protein [Tsukamurella paurometabola]ADG80817.1 hypothetical protein Tpau_4249 [Tsukamurella paurometabola DSM 20162]SUQ39267.1 Uncharacterised protein [Tsukamurella paurometabola]